MGRTRLISAATAVGRPAGGVSSSGPPFITASGVPARASAKAASEARTTALAPPVVGNVAAETATAVKSRLAPAIRVSVIVCAAAAGPATAPTTDAARSMTAATIPTSRRATRAPPRCRPPIRAGRRHASSTSGRRVLQRRRAGLTGPHVVRGRSATTVHGLHPGPGRPCSTAGRRAGSSARLACLNHPGSLSPRIPNGRRARRRPGRTHRHVCASGCQVSVARMLLMSVGRQRAAQRCG